MIGIGAHSGPAKFVIFEMPVSLVPQLHVDRVAATGCVPVLLPPLPRVEEAIDRLDGLLLLSGPDMDPALYGAVPHPKVSHLDRRRDAAEWALLDAALGAGVPILAFCRGMQLLNVLRGGTLHQHLPDLAGHGGHFLGMTAYGSQQIWLEPASRIAKILGSDSATVPCRHHQGIDRLGTGLSATAQAEDGIVEAVEVPDHPFAVAVQWHAEEVEDESLFLALAEAAAARHRGRHT